MKNSVYRFTTIELRRLQLVLLDMLVELDRICKKNNIRYCIIAGTLLGAVRHKGFIPWDDDLDVAMTRGEYERFREVCQTELNDAKFFFQDNTTDPYYLWGYGRLRCKDSEFVRIGQDHLQMKTGIFLDIFPIDEVPDFPPFRGLFTACCFFIRKVLYAQVGAVFDKSVVRRTVYNLLKRIPIAWTFKQLDKLHNYGHNYGTKYGRILTFPTPKGRPFGYIRKWYIDVADIEFEGHMFPGVRDYDDYLSYKFGDYMTLPPEDKRHGHPVSKFRLPENSNSKSV